MRHPTPVRACALALAIGLAPAALAQQTTDPYPLPPPAGDSSTYPPPYQPPQDTGLPPDTSTPQPGDPLVTQPQPGLEEAPPDGQPVPEEALLDGHIRSGPFLAGPGSLTFILHNSLLGAAGGFGTQLISSRLDFNRAKESLLVGTLVGAGVGFGISTWWQFTHWMDRPVASFTVVNALYAGMLAAGLVDSLSTDWTALAWSSFVAAELGGWLTAAIGGGDMRLADGLAMTSAGFWSAATAAMVLASMTFSGSGSPPTSKTWVDALLITPGLGASAMALALFQIRPSATQVLRANAFGLGLGAVVMVTAGFVIGFTSPTTYILTLLSSALAVSAVSLFWVEAAEKSPLEAPLESLLGGARRSYASGAKKKPYNNPWW